MSRLNPFRIGVISTAVALGMLLVDLFWQPIFTIRLTTSFSLPLWILVALYAALQFWLWNATRNKLTLSDDEVARWGAKLELATPQILREIAAKTRVREIAGDVERDHGIPADVTLRYIIALGSLPQEGGEGEGESESESEHEGAAE